MKLKLTKTLFAIAALSMTTACSSSSDGGSQTSVSNLITNTYGDVTEQANKASGDLAADAFVPLALSPRATTFVPDWDTTPTVNNPVTNTQGTYLEYILTQLDPDLLNSNDSSVNVFGRMNTALKIFCAVGVASGLAGVATDSAGYPANGTHTLTFSATAVAIMLSQCGMDASDMTGETMDFTVSSATGSYDKQFTFSAFEQTYLIKSTSTVVNIATGEIHDGGHGMSRTMLTWNKTTDVMLVEYVSARGGSAGPTGLYGYRLFYDEPNDDGQILTYEGNDTSATQGVRYILAGQPQTGTTFSLSLINYGVNSDDAMNGCVNAETGALDDADSLCPTYTAVADDAGTLGVFAQLFADQDSTDWATVTSTSVLNWTDKATMLSTDFDPSL